MALKVEMQDNIVHVVETLHSANGDKQHHWYFDLENNLASSKGMEGDVPDRPMSEGQRKWVETHYLPKVENAEAPSPGL